MNAYGRKTVEAEINNHLPELRIQEERKNAD